MLNLSFAYDRIDITDMIFKISPRQEKIFAYTFAKGDTIVLNANVQSGNSISKIDVIEWPSSIRFQGYDIKEILDKKITVNKNNVYLFKVKNDAIFKSQTYQFKIQRIPVSEEFIDFNTVVVWDTTYDTIYVTCLDTVLVKVDTVFDEIVNTSLKLGSQLTGGTRSSIPVTLPTNIIQWAYWIGVGQEAQDGLKAMEKTLPAAAELLGITNPVAAFAVGLIPDLFSMNQGLDITYYFIRDNTNLRNFMNGESFYQFRERKKIITDYAKNSENEGSFYIGLSNSHSAITSKLVTVKIVAVQIFPKYQYQEIKKPEIILKVTPKLNE